MKCAGLPPPAAAAGGAAAAGAAAVMLLICAIITVMSFSCSPSCSILRLIAICTFGLGCFGLGLVSPLGRERWEVVRGEAARPGTDGGDSRSKRVPAFCEGCVAWPGLAWRGLLRQ